ncbi:MAG TPA: nitrite reductase small subunit NirD [Cytophagaceae bacterium]|jgi:nitrite reductase (NADH) small subunit|nr:nitrite reductase small subunit NirD [Cytophagaceae bacterium]
MVQTEKAVKWKKACKTEDVPVEGGACVLLEDEQVALFNFTSKNEWYATQNLCPHKMQMILSRGIIGTIKEEPKVACPFHKKTFSLKSGECLSGDDYSIKVYPVKIEDGFVYVLI